MIIEPLCCRFSDLCIDLFYIFLCKLAVFCKIICKLYSCKLFDDRSSCYFTPSYLGCFFIL